MSLLGTTVGRIRVVDTLGKGGMGEVYAGVDEKLARKVALKALRSKHRFNAETKNRFLREANFKLAQNLGKWFARTGDQTE